MYKDVQRSALHDEDSYLIENDYIQITKKNFLFLPRPALATLSKSTVFNAFGRPLCFFSVLTETTLEK